MADRRYPLIRGRIFKTDFYQSPQGGGGGDIRLPPRDPKTHRIRLLKQLDTLLAQIQLRPEGQRDPGASRELIAVQPESTYELATSPLGDTKRDVRVIGVTEAGTALLDTKDPEMVLLRRKIDDFADDSKLTKKGARRNAPAIAPIEEIHLVSEADLVGPRLIAAHIESNVRRWFEIACRGGARSPEDTRDSRGQIHRQLKRFGISVPQEFVATEQIVFFARLTLEELRVLTKAVDCIQEFDLAPPDVRDWLLFNDQPAKDIRAFTLKPPPSDAPSVVLLDTGIATGHPMLGKAVLAAGSVLPNDDSAEDRHGHGTQMAGVALYGDDVGLSVEVGTGSARHWLQSVRLLMAPNTGSAAEENRSYWPQLTVDAVAKAEQQDAVRSRPRVFTLAASYDIDIIAPTYWSHAIDRLAFNEGKGRLICIAIGNADVTKVQLIEGYPTLNLEEKVQEPAQSLNALTVGAFTSKTKMPPEQVYAAAKPVAPAGGVSPHTSAGPIAGLHGPDILLEGG
ncbi:MAG TPA: S8 family peptidase, partial [Polyangiaceae bacterium]